MGSLSSNSASAEAETTVFVIEIEFMCSPVCLDLTATITAFYYDFVPIVLFLPYLSPKKFLYRWKDG